MLHHSKGSGAGASKNKIKTGSVIVVSPLVVMVEAEALYPPSLSVSGRIDSGWWSLTLLMLMVDNFMYNPPRSNFEIDKSLGPTQNIHLRPNFHLKDSANKNSSFLVHTVSPQELI